MNSKKENQELDLVKEDYLKEYTAYMDEIILESKKQLIQVCEEYLQEINCEIELYAECIEKEKEISELKELLNNAVLHEQQWRKQYTDLANSKLGRTQRFWWHISKKYFKEKDNRYECRRTFGISASEEKTVAGTNNSFEEGMESR